VGHPLEGRELDDLQRKNPKGGSGQGLAMTASPRRRALLPLTGLGSQACCWLGRCASWLPPPIATGCSENGHSAMIHLPTPLPSFPSLSPTARLGSSPRPPTAPAGALVGHAAGLFRREYKQTQDKMGTASLTMVRQTQHLRKPKECMTHSP
jgi:hypothetical protein